MKTRAAALALASIGAPALAQITSVDLSTYSRVGVFNLPVGIGSNQLAREASAVTYNWDSHTLFVIGDEGTAMVEVDLSGALKGSMTFTGYADPEGLTYIGNGQFVMAEERTRVASRFGYTAGTTFDKDAAQNVKLGTTIGNTGHEGLSYDPQTSGFIFVKERVPQGIFQTTIDFANGTASNGAPTTVLSSNLFDPALLNLLDIADVATLSTVSALNGKPDASHLLLLSEESGLVLEVDRFGEIFSSLNVGVPAQNEGITIDRNGVIYLVNELGGGNVNTPQLWVYAAAAPVPEPGIWMMMGVGLLGLLSRRRHLT